MKSQEYKVLQVGKFFYPDKGGIESTTKFIFDHFVHDENVNDVLCFKRGRGSQKIYCGKSFVLKCGTSFKVASTPISFKFFYWFRKLRNNYDIIHIHSPNPLAAVALFLFPVKGKVLVHWHSDILTHRLLYLFFRPFEKHLLRRADLILGTSPVYVQHSPFISKYDYKANYISSSTEEANFEVDEERVKEIKNEYDGKQLIFALGRFIYYKGFEYLIEAAKYLPDNFVILIGGAGPMKEKYVSLIKNYGLYTRVFLLSDIEQKDLGNYYKACEVFCLPSTEKTEAFGLVLVEAMVFGKPVLSTNIPGSGTSWVNVNNVTGINVEPKNGKALAEGILKIMEEKNYQTFSINSRNRFQEKFTNEKFIDKLKKYYLQLTEPTTAVIKQLNRKAI
jgi:rhamnosyl/mannosyltransferase